ncbi:hypothetical protein [Actinomadura vinacea]
MSTSLANPRRTQLASWPSRSQEHPDQRPEPAVPADPSPSATDDQGTAH